MNKSISGYSPRHTDMSRKLVAVYERYFGEFPGGSTNAYVRRLKPSIEARDAGALSWVLDQIEPTGQPPVLFGSTFAAKSCVEDNSIIQYGDGDAFLDEHPGYISHPEEQAA